MRRLDSWLPLEGSIAALIAIATLMSLQSARAFTSYLVFVVDQSQRVAIGMIAFAVFAAPAIAWLLVRLTGVTRLTAISVLLLAISRLGLQVVEQPVFRIASSALVLITWGLLVVALAGAHRRSVGVGLILGFGLDLALRTFRGPLDLLWTPGAGQTLQIALLLIALVYLWWRVRDDIGSAASDWRSAGALLVIGPAVGLFHLVTGNVPFVATQAGLSASGASALLAAGLLLGVMIALLRLLAISMGAGGSPLVGRFILFDAIIGGVALSFAWSGDGIALLGIFFVTVTVTELVLFALAASPPGEDARFAPVSLLTALGLLIQFGVLFIYYTSSGSGVMLAVAWIGIVAGTLAAAVPLTGALQRGPLNVRAYAAPAIIVLVLLASSTLWSYSSRETPEAQAGSGNGVTVITYNIQSGFSRDNYWDLEATARVIEDSGAEVVILQEVGRGWLVTSGNDELLWLSRRLDMPYAWGPASSDDLWGNAILSRFPITSEKVVKFDSTENLKRSALLVEIDTGSEQLTAIATHLDNPDEASEARAEQVNQLIALLEFDNPTIIAGDFNMPPNDPLVQSVIQAGLVDAGSAAGATGPTSEDGRRIDYIFVTQDLTISQAAIIDSDASDHRPVTVTLELP